MNIPKQLTTVTTFSKVLAGILFILLPVLGFYLGMHYQKIVNETALLESNVISPPVQGLPDTKEVLVPSVLLANPGPYINKIVKVQAIVIPNNLACTLRNCGPGVACCNTCGGGLFLSDSSGETAIPSSNTEGSIHLIGEGVSCSGMDCDIKCTPLEKGEAYIVTGKLVEKTNTGGKTYELEYISHSPAHPSEIIFNGTRLKEGDIFNFSPKDRCVSDIQVKLLKISNNSILLRKLQEQGMNLEYYPVEETETLEIEHNTCIQAVPLCLDVGYQYCFTIQKSQGTLEYSLTTPSESLFPSVQ